MSRDIYNIIAREYERRQKHSADLAEQRKAELYTRIPRLAEIDDEINQLGIKYNRLILFESDNASKHVAEMNKIINALKTEREHLLEHNNISHDYFRPQYYCEKCQDTGFINDNLGSQKCSCYKQQIISHLFIKSNISPIGDECFENFNDSLYPDEINPDKYGISISPRENINNIKNICLDFINSIDDPNRKNLFFSGRTGVGKTFLSFCIARELINQGRTVLYLSAPMLFDIITEHKMKAYKEDSYNDDRYQSIFNVELLIIDDLGTEPLSDARYAELLNILNTRQSQNAVSTCKTIISTNMSPRKLFELYSERIASRINGLFDRQLLAGKDIRSIKC